MNKKRTGLLVLVLALAGCLSIGDSEVQTQTPKTSEPAQTHRNAEAAQPESAEELDKPVTLTIINNLGFDIYSLYIRRSSADVHEETDFLYGDILFNGESVDVAFRHPGVWDILLEDEDRDRYTLSEQSITEDAYCTLTLNMLDY